jgi:hypothetical protein
MFLREDGDVPAGKKLVLLFYATDRQEAHRFRLLLQDYDIVAVVGAENWEGVADDESDEPSCCGGVPVLVQDDLLEEASSIIANVEDTQGLELDDEGELEMINDDQDGVAPSPDNFVLEGANSSDEEDSSGDETI